MTLLRIGLWVAPQSDSDGDGRGTANLAPDAPDRQLEAHNVVPLGEARRRHRIKSLRRFLLVKYGLDLDHLQACREQRQRRDLATKRIGRDIQ